MLEFGGPGGQLVSSGVELKLIARAGSDSAARVQVTNHSDTPLPLDEATSIRLRKAGALGRAVREGFVAEGGDFASRVIALGRRLDTEPSTLVKISYRAEFATLAPGETGEVEVQVNVPENASPDDEWTGRIPVLGSRIATSLKITPKASSRRPPRQRGRRTRGDDE